MYICATKHAVTDAYISAKWTIMMTLTPMGYHIVWYDHVADWIHSIHVKIDILQQMWSCGIVYMFIYIYICSYHLYMVNGLQNIHTTWWRHQMKTFSVLLALCTGNSPVTGEFPSQRPVTQSFDVFFDLRLNKQLSNQSWGWWFETPSRSLWRHCNEILQISPTMVIYVLRFMSSTNVTYRTWRQ